MKETAIDYLINMVLADQPIANERETTRLLKEATAGMPDQTAAELTAEFNRSFGMIGMSTIVDPLGPHADDFRKVCLSILRDISGSVH